MRLVDDDRVVALEQAVVLDLGEQDAVGHHLHERPVARVVGEAHLVADRPAELDVELLGNPVGDGARGDAPRLGVPDLAGDAAPELEQDLRDLRGLPAAGLARDDDHLVVAHRGGDVVAPGADREVGVADPREGRGACRQALLGGGDINGEPIEGVRPPRVVTGAAEPLESAAETTPVAQHHVVEASAQLVRRGRGGVGHGPPRIGGRRPPTDRVAARATLEPGRPAHSDAGAQGWRRHRDQSTRSRVAPPSDLGRRTHHLDRSDHPNRVRDGASRHVPASRRSPRPCARGCRRA